MPLPTTVQSLRAKQFYSQVFGPSYESLQNAARQTPLVIMLWGPRQRTREWTSKRQQIRCELQRLGHTVFFSEQLGVPISAVTKKGVDFLQSETADMIIGMQSSYGVVGAVHHLGGFRVIDRKMFLFIDEAAPDERLYQRALTELRTCYNNVETFKYPDDIVHDSLLKKMIAKVSVMQMAKYRAIQRSGKWGLRFDEYGISATPPGATLHPFSYNLLELYREHRDEIDVLTDFTALFILAYVNHIGGMTLRALSHEVGLAEASLLREMAPLKRGEMIVQSNGVLSVTGFGKRILEGVGLIAPAVPIALPRPAPRPSVMRRGDGVTIGRGVGLSLAATIILMLAGLYWSNTIQNQLPLVYTPTGTTVTRTVTPSLTPLVTPTPTVRR